MQRVNKLYNIFGKPTIDYSDDASESKIEDNVEVKSSHESEEHAKEGNVEEAEEEEVTSA